MAPATIPVRGVVVSERYAKTNEGKVAETVMSEDEGVPEREVVEPVPEREVVEFVDENMPAGEGCTDKAVSTGDEHAPAGDHAATQTATTEMHSTAAEPTMETAATEPTVEATAVERQRWRRHGDCRYHRGKETEPYELHDTDPP